MNNKWEIIAKNAWEAILQKVRSLKDEGKTLQEIADIVGVGNRSNIGEWLKGNRAAENASFANLMLYLERLGFNYEDFFPQTPPQIKRLHQHSPVENVVGPDLSTINVYALAGAGPAQLPEDLEPLFNITAPPEYFRQSNFAVKVIGHSMEPLIPHGAVVGILKNAPFQANELFLANIPYEGLVIKRVGVDLKNNEFIFKSENPDKNAYPDFRISINDSESIVIGRVMWVMWGY